MEVKINLVVSFDANASEVLSNLANAIAAKKVSQEVETTPKEPKMPTTKVIEKPAVETPTEVSTTPVAPAPVKPTEKAPAKADGITIEKLRVILGGKSRAGFKKEIEDILFTYGSKILKNIDPANYADIAAKVEAL